MAVAIMTAGTMAWAAQRVAPVMNPSGIQWQGNGDWESATLRVSGPEGLTFEEAFRAGESPALGLADGWGNVLPDGQYAYELSFSPRLSAEARALMTEVAADPSLREELAGKLPRTETASGYFRVQDGAIVTGDRPEPAARAGARDTGGPVGVSEPAVIGVSEPDQTINDDLIVKGSICAGLDCVTNMNFGFDTLVLQENNLRILANDTSSTASFPSNDWRITFNDSTNGGANKFSIDDVNAGRSSFTIEAGARSNALFVRSNGNIGIGTNTPVVNLHVVSGNTPTLRLEQDGSQGFTAQTWDVAGNEANFFVRDVTFGSRLPFRIVPGAPTNALTLQNDGDIGIGTNSPAAGTTVHVKDTSPVLWMEADATGSSAIITVGNGETIALGFDTSSGTAGTTFAVNVNDGAGGAAAFTFKQNGNLQIPGDLITDTTTYPDYVFEKDYELMGLAELAAFIEREGHLPNVPSRADVDAAGGKVRVNKLQITLLEKIEELTLYTLHQQQAIEAKDSQIVELAARLSRLEAAVSGVDQ